MHNLRFRAAAKFFFVRSFAKSRALSSPSCYLWPSFSDMPSLRTLSFPLYHPSKGDRCKTSVFISSMSSTADSLLVKEQMGPENEVPKVELLHGVDDLYGGVVVNMTEYMDSETFDLKLRASISYWKHQGKRAVWIKLSIKLSNLVDPAVQAGFRYHHAEPDYLMLVHWLATTPDTIPVNASHRVGIGAFVVNSKRQVLVVQERNGGFKGIGVWKLPTGVVDAGEDICNAAVREVKEETGIEAEFVEILAFRQSHRSFFGKSDLFFVCMLRPLSCEIGMQDSEIEAAKWMPIDEYVNQPYNQEHQLFKSIAEICKTKLEGEYAGFSAISTATASGKLTYLYFNNKDFSKH